MLLSIHDCGRVYTLLPLPDATMAGDKFAACKEGRMLALSQKQEDDLKKFWGAYVKDDPRS